VLVVVHLAEEEYLCRAVWAGDLEVGVVVLMEKANGDVHW
jgi:hypothetical protein